ncbi:sulfotransferase family 2 domain-containing protein [Oceanimonas pelagia]|uniref:Sulfotransferase family 2 domain-containing protein n=1 Tax=Oceanimonas pelagia TaxID=3028314 RepID=A0AA50KMV3_9GAMM|nr:sulfotransferase family 2 domain-containing protein [Oceanimonas pelagia]WMC09827.1 sulfotransferase family 2 domain-containing protein [Oceanimonas pelagia]
MLINDHDGWVFIHNPKCAGTTVRQSLMQYETRNDYYWLFDMLDGRQIDKAHLPLALLKRYAPSDFALLSDYRVFGFVRDPVTRMVSSYNESHPRIYQKFSQGRLSLDDYRQGLNQFCYGLEAQALKGWDFDYRHCIPQRDMFYLRGKCYADVLIKMESLERQVNKLAAIDHRLPAALVLKNKRANSKTLPVAHNELLDQKALASVKAIYHDDFVLFDYVH